MDPDAIYARISEILASGSLTEDTLAELSQLWALQNAYTQQRDYDLQQRDLDYKNRYIDFQTQELGLRGKELEQAIAEFEFKSGPYFEFYKENELAKLRASTKQSEDDVLRSANYLQQQRYATEAAAMNRDTARFQMQQALGIAGPAAGQGVPVMPNKMFASANSFANRGY